MSYGWPRPAGRALWPSSAVGTARGALEPFELRQQLCLGLAPVRIVRDAGNRANDLALRFGEMAHALGAAIRVDYVDLGARADGAVRTHGFAHVAIDAFIGDDQCHGAGAWSGTYFNLSDSVRAVARSWL
ncbi:Translation-associated GTPase (modular protein) [Burkholderiales bacterium]|nr:Translation-associated GTPase (modular protein) [Burkholderiales bacterium]